MRLTFDGEALPDWATFLRKTREKYHVDGTFSVSRLSGSPTGEIIGVGDEYVLFATDSARTVAAIQLASDDVSLSVCYCSVLDDCWLFYAPPGSGNPVTTSVARCPTYATEFVGVRPEDDQKWAQRILDGGATDASDAAAARDAP
jgi:hypothetical protein